MAEYEGPTLQNVSEALHRLADRAEDTCRLCVEPYIVFTLELAMNVLEKQVPGLDDSDAHRSAHDVAGQWLWEADTLHQQGYMADAMAAALHGLGCDPHCPQLWRTAGLACRGLGNIDLTIRMLWHALWIHPGYTAARHDLEALVEQHGGHDPPLP